MENLKVVELCVRHKKVWHSAEYMLFALVDSSRRVFDDSSWLVRGQHAVFEWGRWRLATV